MVRACLNKPNKVYSFTELKETQTLEFSRLCWGNGIQNRLGLGRRLKAGEGGTLSLDKAINSSPVEEELIMFSVQKKKSSSRGAEFPWKRRRRSFPFSLVKEREDLPCQVKDFVLDSHFSACESLGRTEACGWDPGNMHRRGLLLVSCASKFLPC